jgi:hypothetical protein
MDANATFGGPSGLPDNSPDFSHAISADGSRVFWSTVARGEGREEEPVARPVALYAREHPTSPAATTVQLDAAETGASGASGGGRFWSASRDGSKVYFTDCSRLTPTSTADESEGCQHVTGPHEVQTGNDLYEYDFERPPGERAIDLTVDSNPSDPRGADVQGVIGVSEDGSLVYFVAGGVLTDQPNSQGEAPTTRECEFAGGTSKPGEPQYEEEHGHLPAGLGCNLYEEHNNGTEWERPRYIAALAAKDDYRTETLNDPASGSGEIAGDWVPDLGSRTAEVSPDGLHLVFESTQALTGYDVSNVGPADQSEGGDEVFVFDAQTGKLVCASCDPTGAPPQPDIEFGGAGFATYLPVSASNTFVRRWMNAQGTEVFFDSSQPLVSGDGNGTQDVYEWESEGSTSCPAATSINGGCVFLLSSGESSDFSFFVDADQSGENVFLTHRGQLGAAGRADNKVHLYDLRVGGGFPEVSTGCAGASCSSTPEGAQVPAAPPSLGFSGAGNFAPPPQLKARPKTPAEIRAQHLTQTLKACRRKYSSKRTKKQRTTCERHARKRYGPPAKKAKKRSARH